MKFPRSERKPLGPSGSACNFCLHRIKEVHNNSFLLWSMSWNKNLNPRHKNHSHLLPAKLSKRRLAGEQKVCLQWGYHFRQPDLCQQVHDSPINTNSGAAQNNYNGNKSITKGPVSKWFKSFLLPWWLYIIIQILSCQSTIAIMALKQTSPHIFHRKSKY